MTNEPAIDEIIAAAGPDAARAVAHAVDKDGPTTGCGPEDVRSVVELVESWRRRAASRVERTVTYVRPATLLARLEAAGISDARRLAESDDLTYEERQVRHQAWLNSACHGCWHMYGCTHRRATCHRCRYQIMLALPDDRRWASGEWQPGEVVWLDDSGRRGCTNRAPFWHEPPPTGLVDG